jgi:hypothetical protein
VSPPGGDDLLTILQLVARILARRRFVHMVVGAWALGAWGRPRATLDLDFLVAAGDSGLDPLAAALGPAGMVRDARWEQRNPSLRGLHLRLRHAGVPIDLMVPRDEHDQQALARRRRKRIQGRLLWFVAPEDFVLQKIKVGRPRDFEDAASVLDRCGARLDLSYLRRWARRLRVAGELSYLLQRRG